MFIVYLQSPFVTGQGSAELLTIPYINTKLEEAGIDAIWAHTMQEEDCKEAAAAAAAAGAGALAAQC
jgi:hypothetical protein